MSADSNAIVFTRTTQQVLNIVYLSANTTPGGFFPNGVNSQLISADGCWW